jgi:23S rRNA G2445 N2-methylase RlmL
VAARDRTGVVFDPCCGTGTIPAAAYAEKRDAG